MSLLKLLLNTAVPLPRIENCQRFLFVGPHPDDIEIGAGATAAALAAGGKTIRFLICTDGRYGTANRPDIPPEEMAEIRKKESLAAAAELGVDSVRFLDLCDGGFYDPAELKSRIAAEIGEFQPEVVFGPDPCVTSECHRDHLNVGEAVREVAHFAPYAGIMERYGAKAAPVEAIAYYYTASPNRFVDTTGFFNRQQKALFGCHVSQFPENSADRKSVALYLKLRAFDFGVRSFHRTAEGFRVLGRTQMHCFPEAGR